MSIHFKSEKKFQSFYFQYFIKYTVPTVEQFHKKHYEYFDPNIIEKNTVIKEYYQQFLTIVHQRS